MLAQNLIRKDKAEALFRLGVSEESANLIATPSPSQILKIAASILMVGVLNDSKQVERAGRH